MDETTVQELADREAIRDLFALYCERLDEYDIDAMAQVFTEDCVTDYGADRGGTIHGRQAAHDRIVKSHAAWRRTHHQLGQSRIALHGDTARSVTYCTAWHERWDGTVESVRIRYVDELVRTAEGWRIARRELWVAGVEGFEGSEWRWVPRAEPQP